ncbi:MAG: methyltransferase domain-containing protein [archaeon]
MSANSNSNIFEILRKKEGEFPLASQYLMELGELFPDEAYLLLPYDKLKYAKRKANFNRIAKFLNVGEKTLTIELGCGSGQMTLPIQQRTGGKVISIDINQQVVNEAKTLNQNNPSIDYVVTDFTHWADSDLLSKANQIIASKFFHEIYSKYGEGGFYQALQKCYSILGQGNKLIIIDGVHPVDSTVNLQFRDTQTEKQFHRFTKLFQALYIDFESKGDKTLRVNIGEFVRFLNGLKFVVPENLRDYEQSLSSIEDERQRTARAYYIFDHYQYPIGRYAKEFNQDYTFYSQVQWTNSLKSVGFDIKHYTLCNEHEIEAVFWQSGIRILEPKMDLPKIYASIICEKN